jgi:hypothetical protein
LPWQRVAPRIVARGGCGFCCGANVSRNGCAAGVVKSRSGVGEKLWIPVLRRNAIEVIFEGKHVKKHRFWRLNNILIFSH